MLALGMSPHKWNPQEAQEAQEAQDETSTYWRDWLQGLTYFGPRGEQVRRSALTVHLLGYTPTGSLVAAPTTSLPERIRGDRNYDYRYAWVRDASLSLAILAMAGQPDKAEQVLSAAEAVAGELGIFAEEVDARTRTFLGNTPLLFSHVEYVRAIVEIGKARPFDMARLAAGQLTRKIEGIRKSDDKD